MLIQGAPNYLEFGKFKEYFGELYCFEDTCNGCQFVDSCEFVEEEVNVSDHINLRRAFIPHDDFTLFAADYSGIELRVAAMVSGEPVWVDEFIKPPMCPKHGDRSEQYHLNVKCSLCGEKLLKADPHSATAQLIYGNIFIEANKDMKKYYRQIGKTANFGLIYGGTKYTLARAASISVEEAEKVKVAFFRALKGIRGWQLAEEAKSKKSIYAKTLLNRIRPIEEVRDLNFNVVAYGIRTWWNHIVQGTAADIMKLAMIKVSALITEKGWDNDCRLMLTVHDELVFEVRSDKIDLIVPAVSDAMLLQNLGINWLVPLEVEVEYGSSWDVDHVYTGPGSKLEIVTKPEVKITSGDGIVNQKDYHKDVRVESLVYTFKYDGNLDENSLDKINTYINMCPGDHELILEFKDGISIKVENRKVDSIRFEKCFENLKLSVL